MMPIFKSVETPLTDAVIFESHWIVELCCLVKAFLWPVVIIKRADSFLICFDGSVHYLPTVSSLKYVLKLPLTHIPTPAMIFPSLLTSLMTHPLIEYVSVVFFLYCLFNWLSSRFKVFVKALCGCTLPYK